MIGHLILVAAFVVWTFPQTGEVALRQIVVATEQEAKQLHDSLITGALFESIAAGRGGYIGRMRLSDLRTEVREAVESLQPGNISDPVRVGNTYVLFQVVPEAESHWIDFDEAGAQALADGRNADATANFEKALAQAEAASLGDVRLARSLDTLATAYRLQGRNAEAENLYRRALSVLERMAAPDIEVAQVLNGLGMSLVKQRRFNEAEPLYTRARSIRENRLGPDHPEVAATLHNIAELFAALGRFADAARLYEQSQSLLEKTLGSTHPATTVAEQSFLAFRRSLMSELLERFSKAVSFAELRGTEFERSIREIRELLPLAPLSEYSFVQMKNILVEAGLTSETEDVLRAGLNKFPHSRVLHIYLADLLAETGRTQIAVDVLEQARRLSRPDDVDAAADRQQQAVIQQRIGDMQLALTNVDAAVAAYQRSLELDPAATTTRVKLGKAYFSSGRLQEAIAEFQRAIVQMPDNTEAYLSLSEAQLASGQRDQAAATAARAIELGASDPRALYLLGTALLRMGRRDEGQERLREFARVEAEFENAKSRNREIDATNTAAIESLRDGNGEAAVRQLTEGIVRYPDAARLQMNLALVQSRLGRHQMAVETLESMLEHRIGRAFLIHKILADEYDILGNTEATGSHRKIYLETREAELLVDAQK